MLEMELFAFLQQTADAAYTVTQDGEICSWNTAAERLFGHPAGEVVGRNIDDVLEGRDALGTSAVAGGAGGIRNFDLQARTGSGHWIWVNVSTIVFDNPRSGRRLFVRLARDVDQRRRNEELVHRMLDAARELVSLTQETSHHAPVEPLSDQERRILKLFAGGSNANTIARKLDISPQTLRNHLHHINRKLRTHNRLEAVTHAQWRGLID